MKIRPLVLPLAVLAGLLSAAPASAGTRSEVVAGTLTVTGSDGADIVTIKCGGGNVEVNGGNPGTGSVACADLTAIVVKGLGGGDSIFLERVLPVDFTALSSILAVGGGDADQFHGSPLDDVFSGSGGDDIFYASQGRDQLKGGKGSDEVDVTTDGNVTLTDARLEIGGGTSTLSSIEGAKLVSEGRGVRFDAKGFRGAVFMNAVGGDDVLLGGSGRDSLSGGAGGDRIIGNAGDDLLSGNDGPDDLRGGSGNDRVFGGPGLRPRVRVRVSGELAGRR
ncbi:MAG: calcium-binding protein [Actinomycetota bacterium]